MKGFLLFLGMEAGGHGLSTGSSMFTLLSETLAVAPKDGPPILAAGGLGNGSQLASVLALGASGAVLGTRFLLSPESQYTDVQRRALIAAKTTSSTRSMAFDHARDALGWPRGVDARGLRNSKCFARCLVRNVALFRSFFIGTVDDFEKGVDIDTLRRRYNEGTLKEDPDRIIIWAGAGIGLLNKSQPAKVMHLLFGLLLKSKNDIVFQEVVEEVHWECVERLRAVSSSLPSNRTAKL